MVNNYFNHKPEGKKKRVNPTYMPDAVKIPFSKIGDETLYKQRLDTDPHYATKRKVKGIHAGEGLIQDAIPALESVTKKKEPNESVIQMGSHSLTMNDPVSHVAKAEMEFGKYQFDQGIQLMKDHQQPQTAADAQNMNTANIQQPPADPFAPPGSPGQGM